MKIIFLDIDGVLNSLSHDVVLDMTNPPQIDAEKMNRWNINLLRLLVEKTGASIVISSTWRKDPRHIDKNSPDTEKIQVFKNHFSYHGWENAPVIGLTPNLSGFRGEEVAVWLDNNQVESYVILDDDTDFIFNPEDLPLHRQEKCGFIRFEGSRIIKENRPAHWSNQNLVQTSKITGLSYDNVITVLAMWQPEDELVKEYRAYQLHETHSKKSKP